MDLSIVIPVFNGADFIAPSIELIHSYLTKSMNVDFEIIIVDDGSTDATRETLEALQLPNCTIISLPENQGKFGAITAGMIAASGNCRIFTDSDIPYDLEAIQYMYDLIDRRSFHVVVGDRSLKNSEYTDQLSPIRAIVTSMFTMFVRLLVSAGLHDTQCGLKALRGDVANAIFPLLRDRSFSGDVEILYIALKYNLEVKRIPVRLRRSSKSSVHVLRHGLRMLFRICHLRFSWNSGEYYSETLERLADQRYWNWGQASQGSLEGHNAGKTDSPTPPSKQPRATADAEFLHVSKF